MSKWHKKLLDRWADIFIMKTKKEGPAAAMDYAARTFPEELQKELIPIIEKRRLKR